jgi:hypothetical protein
MTVNAEYVQVGTVFGSTPVNADMAQFVSDCGIVTVQLATDYATLCPYGMPTRPGMTGTSPDRADVPQTIPQGSYITVFQCEADALSAAGALPVPGDVLTEAGASLATEGGSRIATEAN